MLLRKIYVILTAFALCLLPCGCAGNGIDTQEGGTNAVNTEVSADPDVSVSGLTDNARASIVFCADNAQVLYGHDINAKRPIASITKIMTAMISLEYAAANDKAVKITADMYAEGSSMYLKEGDVLRLSELVKGMLAVSGNDAANAAAVAVAGSTEKFAQLMNEKAEQLGMKNSHFVTPSGLDSDEHYSTAYDMALLCSYAMENERFRSFVSQKSLNAEYISPEGKVQTLCNHNKLLSMCGGCIGIKTGFTKKAGRTLTSCAEREGIRLITVTLDDPDDWKDHCRLYDKCFSLVEKVQLCTRGRSISVPLAGGEKDSVFLVPEKDLYAVIRKDEKEKPREVLYAPGFIYYPAVRGRKYGKIQFTLRNRVIAQCSLVPGEER